MHLSNPTRTRARPRKPAIALILVAAFLAATSQHVAADTFPGNEDTRVADSFIHTFCYTTTFTTDTSVGSYAMGTVLDDTTDMRDSFHSSCGNTTDVWWIEGNLSGTLRGYRVCVVAISSSVCDRSNVYLDYAQLDIGSNDWHDRRKTSVHEIGHSVGLDHDTSSAMITGEVPSTALAWRRFSSHDIGHIDTQY